MPKKLTILLILAIFLVPGTTHAAESLSSRLAGRILLQVEQRGQTWFVSPTDHTRHRISTEDEVFVLLRTFGLGISNADLGLIPTDPALGTEKTMAGRLAGRILLQVEDQGQAWYVDPTDLTRHPLGTPAEALAFFRSKALGISDGDLGSIPTEKDTEQVENDRPSTEEADAPNGYIRHDVPFFPQAPYAEWSDIRQHEGCEEASTLLAVAWAQEKPLDAETMRSSIIEMADWEQARFGSHHDTSAQDTADRLFKEYLEYARVEVKRSIGTDDILHELHDGNIVAVPINGRLIGNPYFTPPGPFRHMILVIGYDPATDEFIAHDPGTRRGANIRYSHARLSRSLMDYPSGRYVPVPSAFGTAMIVVEK